MYDRIPGYDAWKLATPPEYESDAEPLACCPKCMTDVLEFDVLDNYTCPKCGLVFDDEGNTSED